METGINSKLRKLKVAALCLHLAIGLLSSDLATAQTKTIQFESANWEQIKAMSARENKLIFLHAYATWCGVCKKMDKNVFTDDAVANYFNANFINARIDMESGEGIAIAKHYNVNVYPTLLFIDAQGNVVHRAEGGFQSEQFIELAKEAQNPAKQNQGITNEAGNQGAQINSAEIGCNISQYHKDFGIGLHVISPYFFMKSVAIKAGTNIQWFKNSSGEKPSFTIYQNIQFGMRGRSFIITDKLGVYGEGGVLIILPNSDFSSRSSVIGGYGSLGCEFRIHPKFAYFAQLGWVGSGATADKIAGKPNYSNGFLANIGMRVGL